MIVMWESQTENDGMKKVGVLSHQPDTERAEDELPMQVKGKRRILVNLKHKS